MNFIHILNLCTFREWFSLFCLNFARTCKKITHSHAPDDPRGHTPDTLPHLHDDKTNHRIVDSDLWIIAPDGTGRQQLTNTPDVMETEPDWSPDGAAIVCGTEETGRLLVLKIGRR